ncbi:hypothetical protein IKG12_01510 [Candidatus Saccharibacteria bacterium]|nr:hypothetical protein [Candidatus Saccharibacteria bacterium]
MRKKTMDQIDEKGNSAYNPDVLSILTDEKRKMLGILYPNAVMLSKKDVSNLLGISMNKVNSLISERSLLAKKLGERTVIPLNNYLNYCEQLPDKENKIYEL